MLKNLKSQYIAWSAIETEYSKILNNQFNHYVFKLSKLIIIY